MTTTFTDPSGTHLAGSFAPVRLSESDISSIVIVCTFGTSAVEVVWQEDPSTGFGAFTPRYRCSTFVAAGNGGDFVLRRVEGWPSGFQISVLRPFPGGGGGVILPFSGAIKTVDFIPAMAVTSRVDLSTVDVTAALPAASGYVNQMTGVTVVAASKSLTLTVQAGEKLNGVLNGFRSYSTNGASVVLQSDGFQWWIVNEVIAESVTP